MGRNTSIQWCHDTVNPVMGCDGCELYPTSGTIRQKLADILCKNGRMNDALRDVIAMLTRNGPQAVRRDIAQIADGLARAAVPSGAPHEVAELASQLSSEVIKLYVCYAGTLHRFVNANGRAKGYAYPFENPTTFPGRMMVATRGPEPTQSDIATKPWLHAFKKLIFISDMGDAFSRGISFEYLRDEVIAAVASPAGLRHVWLWLTKRPERMAKFSAWLSARSIQWPENLVAMTSITSSATVGRVAQLQRVEARYRALSVEPLWGEVHLPLEGIDWVIVGGQSGPCSKPFHVEWAERIMNDCRADGSAFFLKQLGRRPFRSGVELQLRDEHGGDWDEWPEVLRIRELPAAWRMPSPIPARIPAVA